MNAAMLPIKSIFIRNVLRPTNSMRFTIVFPGSRENAGLVPKIHCYTAYFSCVPPNINFKISAQMQHSKHRIQPRCSVSFPCCILQKPIAQRCTFPSARLYPKRARTGEPSKRQIYIPSPRTNTRSASQYTSGFSALVL